MATSRVRTLVIAASTLGSLFVAQQAHASAPAAVAPAAGHPALWGIDTTDNVQTSGDITQTEADLGTPQFVGRYLVYSSRLSSDRSRIHPQSGCVDSPHRRPESRVHVGKRRCAGRDRTGEGARRAARHRDLSRCRDQRSDHVDLHRGVFRGVQRLRIHRRVLRECDQRTVRRRLLLLRSRPTRRSRTTRCCTRASPSTPAATLAARPGRVSVRTFRRARIAPPRGSTSSAGSSPRGHGRTSMSTSWRVASPPFSGAD